MNSGGPTLVKILVSALSTFCVGVGLSILLPTTAAIALAVGFGFALGLLAGNYS